MSRTEELLQALLNGESPDITPRSRKEKYLKNCCDKCGCDDLPTPRSREEILLYQLADQLAGGGGGGGGGETPSVPYISNGVNFYDYDGTLLHSYTVEEAQALTALPELPEREGLVCQGWNWTLEDIKAQNRAVDVGATYITADGKTRIYIKLEEGRTSPMLGVCPHGTVTVDWGDGTEPDTLTGAGAIRWTPTHNYATAGEYVITLAVDGKMDFYGTSSSYEGAGILRYSQNADGRNRVYQTSVQKIQVGNGVTSIGKYAFNNCYSLTDISLPDGVTSIGERAFYHCYSLTGVSLPDGVTSIGDYTFSDCYSLTDVSLPDGVTSIGERAFCNCYSLTGVSLPDGVTSIGTSAFQSCYSLTDISLPDGVASIGNYAFNNCYSLTGISLPNGVTSIGNGAFNNCYLLTGVSLPNGVTSIGNGAFNNCYLLTGVSLPDGVTSISSDAFKNCYGAIYYDFSNHTTVPSLSNTNAFSGIPSDCEIRVPSALYEEWIGATNWANYADYIVAV